MPIDPTWRRGARLTLAVVVVIATVAACVGLHAEPASPSGRNMSYYEVRRGLFAMSKIESAPIVMLGDSLTEAGPWTDLTGCLQIANRGIGGDTTTKLRDRLDEVIALRPRAIFLMIGVNDLTLKIARETTLENLRAILARLSGSGAQVFFSYVLPVTASYHKKRINRDITGLNGEIAKLAYGVPNVMLIDARPQLRGDDGFLRREFSYDGLHLTPKGYAVLRDAVAPYIAQYCVT
ncbi:MAG: GDSL-type esterase/lipase family protein [Xanthobacteraceae bacterium]